MTGLPWKTIWLGLVLLALPARAGTIEQNGSVIVIGPDAQWTPGDACTAPVRPVGNGDSGAISNYQAARDKFMDCVRHEADTDKEKFQHDLDMSLAAIGDDPSQQTDIIQQETRGAANRLGAGGYRK